MSDVNQADLSNEPQSNWAGNYTYGAARRHWPKTVEHVQELVRQCSKLKALGTRHSFNGIADTSEDLVVLTHFDRVLALDSEARTVTVEAGVRYGWLGQYLNRLGFAVPNLASLPHISVAGACATATHGSGDRNGNLATTVAALEVVTADGEVRTLSRQRHSPQFQGMVVGLGGLGLVTKLTLDIIPAFEVQQVVYENLPTAQLENHFEEVFSSGYSVSLFTDWRGERYHQVWLKRRVTDGLTFEFEPVWFKATLATHAWHPIAELSPVNCTEQLGRPGPWHERLPHFRMDYTPSSGEELQTEYFVPRQHGLAALRAIHDIGEHVAPLLHVSEVRTIAADDLWMSPCFRRDCVSIHFTWKKDWPAVRPLLPLIEEKLAPFGARPHWGKLFAMPAAQLQAQYEKLLDFRELLRSYDPHGKFRNAFVNQYIFGDR